MPDCQECGGPFEPRRAHGRFCGDYCRIRWNRRNAREPAEASAASREAAVDLALLVGAPAQIDAAVIPADAGG